MISTSSLVLDGHHGHRLGPGLGPGPGGPHHMTFVDPYLGNKLPGVPEFIRPFPKPAPIVPRFNGQKPSPSQSPRKDYTSVPVSTTSASGPVNLTSVKLDGGNLTDSHLSSSVNIQLPHLPTAYNSRMFPPSAFPYSSLQNPYGSLYPNSYPSLLNRPTYINSAPLSPLERQYSPPQKTNGNSNSSSVFLQPSGNYPNPNPSQAAPPPPPPPPQSVKSGQSMIREKRPFKIPSGKESNGKQKSVSSAKNTAKRVTLSSHVNNGNNSSNNNSNSSNSSSNNNSSSNINNSNNNSNNNNNSGNNSNNNNNNNNTSNNNNNNNNNNSNNSSSSNNNNNNLLPPNFTKGSLIQLANGDLRRVEDVTTEELVSSAEKCPAFRLDPSTVVRIEESSHGTVLLTLSYGENKKTIEMESTLEHPYFVYGQGWASCSPERTMNCYGLQCHRLQVGDICISLSPRQRIY